MLLKDLEQNIYAIGGRRVEYTELVENEETYFTCKLKQLNSYKDVVHKDLSPSTLIYRYSEYKYPDEWEFIFYYIPKKYVLEVKTSQNQLKEESFKEILLWVVTSDGINQLDGDMFIPQNINLQKLNLLTKNIFNKKKSLLDIEKNIFALEGRKIDFKELSKNIHQYVYYYLHNTRIYCKNTLNRIKNMSENELVYFLSGKEFLDDYTLRFYYIPYMSKNRKKELNVFSVYSDRFTGDDNNLISVIDILVVTGTYDNKSLEYFNIFFPFDMLEEKQKEIKEFIFNNK